MSLSHWWSDAVSFELCLLMSHDLTIFLKKIHRAKSPVIIEASEKFRIDSETPLKAAVGITISHIYFVINGMLIFSEAHNDLRFMNRPLKYLITDNSLRIHEINAHMLNTEIGRLRVKQSRVRFPPNPVSVFRVKAQA